LALQLRFLMPAAVSFLLRQRGLAAFSTTNRC
jgi:hypothetical protein